MTTDTHKDPATVLPTMSSTDAPAPHAHEHESCPNCLINPSRSRSSLVAWIVAAAAVGFALLVWFSRSGSLAANAGGFGALSLMAILVCPLVMGAMMFFMMRKGA